MAADKNYEYGVPVRFVKRRNQKHIRIRVKDGEIIVSAPYGTPEHLMRTYCRENKAWITASLRKIEKRSNDVRAQNRFSENFLLYEGNWVPFRIKTQRPMYGDMDFDGHEIVFTIPESITFTAEIAAKLYRNWAAPRLQFRFLEKTVPLPFNPGRITVRSQKTKWGSCSSKGNINLNWRLIQCPTWIQDYIFIHELCHLKHLNHSPAFWELVDFYFPRRKEAEKWLNKNGSVVFENP